MIARESLPTMRNLPLNFKVSRESISDQCGTMKKDAQDPLCWMKTHIDELGSRASGFNQLCHMK